MNWQTYHIIFRLRSPLHIGCGKVGNLQRTYPFITGRVFWGALAMRITRDNPEFLEEHGTAAYNLVGNLIHQEIAFTYFFPSIITGRKYNVLWPWDPKRRLLRSYVSTALAYPEQKAKEASLHELEFISPYTLDSAEPVFLQGYLIVKEKTTLKWNHSLNKLQFGAERCYGWGNIHLEVCSLVSEPYDLFDGKAKIIIEERPIIQISDPENQRLLAHTEANKINAQGQIEPLVGREWKADKESNQYAGQHVAFNSMCFQPGSKITSPQNFRISNYGIWTPIDKTPI